VLVVPGIAPLPLVGCSACDLPSLAVLDLRIGILDEKAAEHAFVVAQVGLDAAALVVDEYARALLPRQRGKGVVVVARREEHLDELLGTSVIAAIARRGGLRARIVTGGVIHLGDPIEEIT